MTCLDTSTEDRLRRDLLCVSQTTDRNLKHLPEITRVIDIHTTHHPHGSQQDPQLTALTTDVVGVLPGGH